MAVGAGASRASGTVGESRAVLAAVEAGTVRVTDMPPILGVTSNAS